MNNILPLNTGLPVGSWFFIVSPIILILGIIILKYNPVIEAKQINLKRIFGTILILFGTIGLALFIFMEVVINSINI